MFKYPKAQKEENKPNDDAIPAQAGIHNREPGVDSRSPSGMTIEPEPPKKDVSPEALRELLEKNLKWSQIIYEQTRKINSKLFWKSVWGWVMFLIFVVVPTALSIWYLPSLLRGLESKYQPLLSLMGSGGATSTVNNKGSVDEILKLLPVSDEQKANLKAMLGTK